MNLGTYLDQRVDRYGQRTFLHYYDRTLTYAELGEQVDRLAHGLRRLGFREGDFVHVLEVNSPEVLVAYFAIQKIGAIAGPINGLWKADEIEYLLNDSGGRGLIIGSAFVPLLAQIRARCPRLETVIEIGAQVKEGHASFGQLIADSPAERFECAAAEEAPCYIFYTSGTTGNPKGVLLSHKNVFADVRSFQETAQLDEGYRILIFLPLFHVNAMLTSVSTVDKGGAVVLRQKFSASEFFEVVEKYRVNFFSGVPAIYSFLLADPGRDTLQPGGAGGGSRKRDRSSLQFGICGAAPMPVETFKEFERTFGIPIVEGYGLTEATCVSTLNPIRGLRKVGSIGLPCAGQEVLIVDEAGNELPAGEPGEIVIRGDVVMLGYHNRPEETAETLAGGMLHTGDVGKKDEDGYIFIVDRLKDMVIRGGENIYPKEIDYLLVEHPKIRDAACVGVPDAALGEELCAYVVPREGEALTEDEVVAFCRERLADYKVPRYVRVLDRDFPRNAVGKILKKELKSWGVEGLEKHTLEQGEDERSAR
jgi:long-chain acyl-CoA synthetase